MTAYRTFSPSGLHRLGLYCAMALLACAPVMAQSGPSGTTAKAQPVTKAQPAVKKSATRKAARRAGKAAPAAVGAAVATAAVASHSGQTPAVQQPTAVVDAAGVRQADFIVAIVNSEPVTNHEVHDRTQRIIAGLREQQAADIHPHELYAQVLEQLISERAQLHMARDQGVRVDDYAVEQAILNIAHQNGMDVPTLIDGLVRQGRSEAKLRQELREQLTMQRLREQEMSGRVKVSEQDIQQYLAQQRRQNPLGDAQAFNLGHILVPVAESASEAEVLQQQALAQQVAQALRSGADLHKLAASHSAIAEPVMGMRPVAHYPALFVQAVTDAPIGAVIGPLRSAAGFHVLKMLDRSVAGVPSVMVQNRARHILLRPSASMDERQLVARMQELLQRIERGQASFESVAREYSQDGSAEAGGDLGWSMPGQYVPEFENALNVLQPGQISAPVLSRFGVHLIRLDERREVALTPQEQRVVLANIVRAQKEEKAFEDWLQEVRAQAYVQYREPPQ